MLIDIKDAPDQARRIFKKLTDMFEEQGITPTPLNYYVWYQYFKGNIPKFTKELDTALNDPFGYNDRLGKRLYETYLSEEDEADTNFDRALKRLISSVIKKMDFWSDLLNKQTDELSKVASTLEEGEIDQKQLQSLTHNILETANSMKQSSKDFQNDILNTQDEVTELRAELIKAKAQIMMDELTEVGNRKAFNNTMIELTEEAKEDPASLSMIMTDIDFFKRFNDNFGHLVGDSVLRYFTSIIKKGKQENETICRYGGEEFAIILSGTTAEAARKRAEEIRHNIEQAKLKRKGSTKELGQITASFGVSTYRGEEETIDDFIQRADDALYLAKESGRNIVKDESEVTS